MNKLKNKIAFIGAGNMAEAILAGIIKQKLVSSKQITAFEVNADRKKFIRKKYKISFAKSLAELCSQADVILLAVKPQQMQEVLTELQPHIKSKLVITIAAGIEIKFYENLLGKQAKVIRVMPNTPALLGLGAAAFFGNRLVKKADKEICHKIFSSVGIALELNKEALLDGVTALSGSGPAFVYQFAASLIAAGKEVGLSEDLCRQLTLQTLLGASQMLINSGEDPQTLTQKVTSKGGTTFAGLEVLEKKGFAKTIADCIMRASQRAKEMSAEFGKTEKS